mmetsp:Transcript_15800/g.32234  ORF Transcript_15800/g.32234 Transcript_15800/m.32234 type:complete len:994 (+) Transcript_15800:244-3225(+)
MSSLPAPAFMSPPALKSKFSTPVSLAAVITPSGKEVSRNSAKPTTGIVHAKAPGPFLVLKTPSRSRDPDLMSSGPLTDPGGRRHSNPSIMSSPTKTEHSFSKPRGRSAKSSSRMRHPAVSQSYQSNPFRSASVKKSGGGAKARRISMHQPPTKPPSSFYKASSGKRGPVSLATLNSYNSSPNLIELENDENLAPNLPSPSSSNSPGKQVLNPLEVPKKSSLQKGRRPNPNARMPRQSQATYRQQLVGVQSARKAKGSMPLTSASASKVSFPSSPPVSKDEMRSSARNLFHDDKATVEAPRGSERTSPAKEYVANGNKTPSSYESPLFKQVDSNERNRRRGVEKGTQELEFQEAGTTPNTPGSSGAKKIPKEMMTKKLTREALLQFMDNEVETNPEMNEAMSKIDIDETVAALISPTKKTRSGRKAPVAAVLPKPHITPTVNLMSQKITPEVLKSLLVVEDEEADEDDTARIIDMDDGETSEEEEEEEEEEQEEEEGELIGSSIDDFEADAFSSSDLMRKKIMPEDFSNLVDEDCIDEEVIVDDEANPMRVSRTLSEASEVEEEETLGDVEDCIEGFKVSGCLSPSVSDVDEDDVSNHDIDANLESEEFAKEPKLDAKISSGEMRQLMDMFGSNETGCDGGAGGQNVERHKTYDDDSDDESIESLGGVYAGDVEMLGPWHDLDEYDVMYKVPVDVHGKVKRRRRRNRHRFRPFHMSLPVIPEVSGGGVPMKKGRQHKGGKDKAKKRDGKAPTVEEILYGVDDPVKHQQNDENAAPAGNQGKVKKSKKSRIQEVITNSKPKTPTKPKAQQRFNRRSQRIVKKDGEEVTQMPVDLSGTIDLGKTAAKLTIGNDTYGQWFAEQIGWCIDDDDDEDGGEKNEIISLFGCIEAKDFQGLELALFGEAREYDCSLFHDVRDDYGNTLLMACCHNGFKRGVKLFVKNGWDLNASNKYGNTALHFAFERGQHKIAEYLKKKGANETLVNEMGLTPYERVGMD